MKSVNDCVAVAEALSAEDRDLVLARVDMLRADGIGPAEAGRTAAQDLLAEAEAELAEFMALVREQHPAAFEEPAKPTAPPQARYFTNPSEYAGEPDIRFSGAQPKGRVSPASVVEQSVADGAARIAEYIRRGGVRQSVQVGLGGTPHVLRMLGYPRNGLVVDNSILDKVFLGKHKDETRKLTPRGLMEALHQPAAVWRSGQDLMLMLPLQGTEGAPIVAPLRVEGPNAQVKSIYELNPPQQAVNNLASALQKGGVLYADIAGTERALQSKSPLAGAAAAGGLRSSGAGTAAGQASPEVTPPGSKPSSSMLGVEVGRQNPQQAAPLTRTPDRLGNDSRARIFEQLRQAVNVGTVKGRGDLTTWIATNYIGPGEEMPRFSRAQTETPEFKAWFGDSKVVGADGKPLVVYHGTHRDFSVFDPKAPSTHIPLPGFYFTPDPDVASTFAESGAKMAENKAGRPFVPLGANVMPAYLALQNPLDFNASEGVMKGFVSEKIIREIILDAQRKGHDGVVIRGWRDGSGPVQYVAFRPEQIKSAIGNRGTFDPNNPDIRFSRDLYDTSKTYYHGTTAKADFKRFKPGKEGVGVNELGPGIYVTDRPMYAGTWARGEGGRVLPVYLRKGDIYDLGAFRRRRGVGSDAEQINQLFLPIVQRIKERHQAVANPTDPRDLWKTWIDETDADFARHIMNTAKHASILPWLDRAGYIGVKDDDSQIPGQINVLRPEYLKSAIGNRGTFDPNNPDIRFARNQPPAAGATPPATPTWTIGDKTGALDTFIYQMQDKTVDLKDLVKAISGTAPAPLSVRADARLRETLFHGRVADRSKRFVRDELRPLITEMQAGGVTMAALGEYLHARHAEERNIAMEAINPSHPDKDWLSGMKTSDARRILASAPPLMARLAQRVDAINDATLTLMELAGLETPETIQAIRDAYDYYTPLHRDEAHPDSKVPIGSGFSVTGSPLKRATGSTEAVDHGKILAHIAERRDAVIARAEKTLVGQAIYKLALDNPNPDFWTTDVPPTIARIDERREIFNPGLKKMVPNPTYNQVIRVTDPVVHGPGYEHVLIVKVRGQDRMITFNKRNERAARLVASLKNLDVDTLDPVSNFVGYGTRWIASVNTQYNPIFGIKNLIRDLQGAVLNLTTTAISGKQLQVLAKIPAAMQAIWRVERDGLQAQGAVEDAYRDLSARGGLTGWRDVYANISEREDALKDVLHSIDHGPLRKGGRAILEGLSRFNASIENATRLAAYQTALEAGVAPDRGAVIAKEITVDFNRKGVLSRRLGAWYAFMNASVQGTERTLRTLRGPLGGAIITGGIAMGLAQALLMAGMDDDDREAINEWDLSRNFILPMGDGKFLRVPYALGFHVLPNIGRNLAGMALAKQRGDQIDLISSFGSFLSTALDAFSPVGGGPTVTQFLAPTVFDPFVQLGENTNWGGRPIYRERGPWNEEASGASLGRDTTSPVYHFIAQMLNRASGGEEGVRNIDLPAGFSPQPEAIRHLVETVGGGVWRETEKLIEGLMGWALPGAEPRPTDRWPLTGAFYGDTRAPEAPLSRYYDLTRKVEAAEKGRKSLEESDAPDSDERLQRWMEEHPEAALAKDLKASQKRVLALRKQRHEDFLAGVSESSLTATDNEIAQEMREFNQRYREVVRSAP